MIFKHIAQGLMPSDIHSCLQGLRHLYLKIILVAFAVTMTACGGGSGSALRERTGAPAPTPTPPPASTNDWNPGVFKDAKEYVNKCAVPRTGIDPATKAAYPDTKGSVADENNFLRSWSNDTYLWYSEIPELNPTEYADPLVYFNLLKTSARTPSGKEKDRFHFTYDSADWYAVSEAGVSAGYGFELAWIAENIPRNAVIAYTEPGSPAALATPELKRGARIIKVDGADFINGNDATTISTLNAGLFPDKTGVAHTFEVQDYGADTTYTITLQSASVTKTPVQNVKVIETATGKVGYLLFNDHIKTAERGLYDAINQLNGVSDLVLDIRYNGGGFLYIASELAYMIAGDVKTQGKIFEKIAFNAKHTATDIFGNAITPTPFYNGSADIGGKFPTLNLSRVFVITSGDTCSASESIINGLRGANVEVIQIGSKTCGKPYGFYPQDNCGTTYFTIQFKGVNDKGFGEYSDGFVPASTDNGMDNVKGCSLGDDLTHPLGDTAERNLATALYYRDKGSCAVASSMDDIRLQKTFRNNSLQDHTDIQATLKKAPGLTNRIMQ